LGGDLQVGCPLTRGVPCCCVARVVLPAAVCVAQTGMRRCGHSMTAISASALVVSGGLDLSGTAPLWSRCERVALVLARPCRPVEHAKAPGAATSFAHSCRPRRPPGLQALTYTGTGAGPHACKEHLIIRWARQVMDYHPKAGAHDNEGQVHDLEPAPATQAPHAASIPSPLHPEDHVSSDFKGSISELKALLKARNVSPRLLLSLTHSPPSLPDPKPPLLLPLSPILNARALPVVACAPASPALHDAMPSVGVAKTRGKTPCSSLVRCLSTCLVCSFSLSLGTTCVSRARRGLTVAGSVWTCVGGVDACVGGAEEMAKCTERSELLHLLHASAPPRSASLARDEPVCVFDISWEALEISYAKGGEVCCACRPAPPLCNSYLHCIWLSDTQRVLLDSTALFALYPASSVFALYPARPLLVRAHAPRLERPGSMGNHMLSFAQSLDFTTCSQLKHAARRDWRLMRLRASPTRQCSSRQRTRTNAASSSSGPLPCRLLCGALVSSAAPLLPPLISTTSGDERGREGPTCCAPVPKPSKDTASDMCSQSVKRKDCKGRGSGR
jgi:hypothetical protein